MKKYFSDIQVGDKVIVCDEYSHDYAEHLLEVTSIEYDKDWITKTNPKGMYCYGDDLDREKWGDNYISQVHEGNFIRFQGTGKRVKVYGASDDLVEIENSDYKENEIGCYNSDVRIRFVDGTVIRIGYPKRLSSDVTIAVWWIKVEKIGTALSTLALCANEDANPYSDVFEIESEIKSHSVIKQKYPCK